MTTYDPVHTAPRKRPVRFHPFNFICWGLGVAIGLTGLYLTQQLQWLLAFPLGFVVGLPVKDYGSPHAWLLSKWRIRRAWKRAHGVLRRPPLSATGKKGTPLTKLDHVRLVEANILDGPALTKLPLYTTTSGDDLTVLLLISGASPDWISGDGNDKFGWDLRFIAAMKHAFDATRTPAISYAMGRIQRPSNREPGLLYNKRRGNQDIFWAAAENHVHPEDAAKQASSPEELAKATIGSQIHDNFDKIHAIAGGSTHYAALTLPWPTGHFGRKVDLANPIAFRKSALWKTLSKVAASYRACGIPARLPSTAEAEDFWTTALSHTELPTQQFYQQLRGIAGEASESNGMLRVPMSAACTKEGVIRIGGTYMMAGYATAFNRSNLYPGFQPNLAVLDNDVAYTFATYVDAKHIGSEKHRAREAERGRRMLRDLSGGALNKGVSDPAHEMALADDISYRRELEDAGQRSGDGYFLFTVMARSDEDVLIKWEDTITQLGGIYEIEQLYDPEEVFDTVLAQLCIKVR